MLAPAILALLGAFQPEQSVALQLKPPTKFPNPTTTPDVAVPTPDAAVPVAARMGRDENGCGEDGSRGGDVHQLKMDNTAPSSIFLPSAEEPMFGQQPRPIVGGPTFNNADLNRDNNTFECCAHRTAACVECATSPLCQLGTLITRCCCPTCLDEGCAWGRGAPRQNPAKQKA